jgi:hypothetical protein
MGRGGGRFGNQRPRYDQFEPDHGMEQVRPIEEYKDLDDPMFATSATSQQSIKQAAAPVVPAAASKSKANRQMVSYDDLF